MKKNQRNGKMESVIEMKKIMYYLIKKKSCIYKQ